MLFCCAQIEHDGIIWLFAFLSSQIKFICNNNFVCFLEWRLDLILLMAQSSLKPHCLGNGRLALHMAWLVRETDMVFSPHITIGSGFFSFFSSKDLARLLVKVVSAAAVP